MGVLVLENFLKSGPSSTLRLLAVLLFDLLGERVHMAKDEVQLRVAAALVRPEHDGVGGLKQTFSQTFSMLY